MSIDSVMNRITDLRSDLTTIDQGLYGSSTSSTSSTSTASDGSSVGDTTDIASLLASLSGGAGGILGQDTYGSDFASMLSGLSGTTTTGTTTTVTATTGSGSTGTSSIASLLAATGASAATGTTASGTTSLGQAIVAEAKTYVGVPYVFGGESRSGIDCSGLVQAVLKTEGITVGRNVQAQATAGVKVEGGLANAQPGDLIITKGEKHVVIYAGNGMVVHAPYPGRTVSYQKNWLSDADIEQIRRVT